MHHGFLFDVSEKDAVPDVNCQISRFDDIGSRQGF